MQENNETKEPKYKKAIEGLDQLSLGISIGIAILIGVGLGFGLKALFGQPWLLWLGVFWGVGAAVNNIYRAYKKQKRELDELAKDPRYSNVNQSGYSNDSNK